MPIYDFECPRCSRKFEFLVKTYAAADNVLCPECGARAKKLPSAGFAIGTVAQKTMARAKDLGFKTFKRKGAGSYEEKL